MILRDRWGLICQHHFEHPDDGYLDGYDSCNRDGIMAGCGDKGSQAVHHLYATNEGLLVRHPYQSEDGANRPSHTSRDALIAWAFGITEDSSNDVRHTALIYANDWFINKDFLDPSVRLYLYKCAGMRPPWYITLMGYPLLYLSLIWNTNIKPNDEQNQFACICIRMGKFWARELWEFHPDIVENVDSYWRGWRQQSEIADALVKKLHDTAYDT